MSRTEGSLDRVRRGVAEALGLAPEEIGNDDDLRHLGLDSLAVMRLATRWKSEGLDVSFGELIEWSTPAEWAALLDRTAGEEPVPEPESTELRATAPLVSPPESSFELTPLQHAYHYGRSEALALGGVGSHFYVEFEGDAVDPDRLADAVLWLQRRHPMLRARFGDDGLGRVRPTGAWSGLVVDDLRELSEDERAERLARTRHRLVHRRFAVDRGEVFDVRLTLLPGGRGRVHVQIDMLVCDATSFRILLDELVRRYTDPGFDPAPPAVDFPAYTVAARAATARARERAEAYWRERLAELPDSGPALPYARDLAGISGHTTIQRSFSVPARARRTFAARARSAGLTESSLVLAAFTEVLAAWSERDRFLLTVPFYGREPVHPEVDTMVGDFTGMVLLDVDAGEPMPFARRARALQDRLRARLANAAYSGIDVLRDLSHRDGEAVLSPIVFTSALGLGELFEPEVRRCLGEPVHSMSQNPQVAIDVQLTDRQGALHVHWDIADGVFLPGVADALVNAVSALVEWAVESEWDVPAPDPRGVRPEDRPGFVDDSPAPSGTLHDPVFAMAARTPDSPAVLGPDGSRGYAELTSEALAVAGGLVERGVRPGDLVAVCLPKGVEQLACVLGVLAAGAAYVPIGVEQPPARRERILRRAGVTHLITQAPRREGTDPGVPVVSPQELRSAEPLEAPCPRSGEDLAYVIFTSGSTGEPKGVEITHAAALNTIVAVNERFGVGPGDRVLAVSALDFDLSVYDLFGMLSVGAALVTVTEDQRRDARAQSELVAEYGVTVWNTVPALLEMLLVAADDGSLSTLRTVLVSGDRVPLDLAERLRPHAPDARFAALGGATEAAIWSNFYEPGPDGVVPAVEAGEPAWRSMPYGFPLPRQRFRVVDARGRDCPDWVTGELWIGGAGVALGYRGDPERTAEQFPVVDGERWYRTRDLGRYRTSGVLEFLGRADNQVKLRGHRIELGEVEAALSGHPGVDAAVALVVDAPNPYLGVVVTTAEPDALESEQVLRHAAEHLPPPMVPETVVAVAALPLTPNGKTDTGALTTLLRQQRERGQDAGGGEPMGPAERLVAEVWADLLDVPSVRRDDNFFLAGGDSIIATRMLARLRDRGIEVPLRRLLDHPVLAEFAEGLVSTGQASAPVLATDPENRYEPFGATETQRAYWLGRSEQFALGGVGSHWYWEFDGVDVDLPRLEDALNGLIERHDMLRAVFDEDGRQRVLPVVERFRIPVTVTDDRGELDRLRDRLSTRIADPARWPLLHVEAVTIGRSTRLAFSFDYLVLDALSIVVLLRELAVRYRDLEAPLPPLRLTFRDYVLGATPPADEVARAREHWLERLDDLPPAPRLPLAADPEAMVAPRFTRLEARLEPEQWRRLTARSREHGVTTSAVLATAYATVLSRFSDRADLTLNLTVFDRRDVHPDIDAVVGDFTSLVLVPFRPRLGAGFAEHALDVQHRIWEAMEHRAASALWVLRELARRTGDAAVTMPVVLTSALGVARDDEPFPFGEPVWGLSQTPQVWLDNQVAERAGGLSVTWDAVEGLLCPGVLETMFAAFVGLLRHLADGDWDGPSVTVTGAAASPPVPLIGAPPAVVPATGTGGLHDAFFAAAQRDPDATALVTPDGAVSFGELSRRALAVAGGLAAAGVGRGDVVAVVLPRGADQITAVLGVVAAGAAYVPVGADQPAARRRRIVENAGAKLAVTEAATADLPDAVVFTDLLAVSPLASPVPGKDDDLAYVIYTSGSTGTPKGVEITHSAALNTVAAITDRFGVDHTDRVLAVSAMDFDLSVYDVFGVLGAGGALVLVGEDARRDARTWVRLVREHGVSLWNSVPALLEMALTVADPGDLASLRTVLVSGDWVPLDLGVRLAEHAPDARLAALGGATEASIWSNVHDVTGVPSVEPGEPPLRSVPYGRPLPGQAYRVVDEFGRDCPEWVTGELWIGGAGVARGYRGDPERTADRFVEVTTEDGRVERWYRTGDLGRYRPGGVLEFLGRRDTQVKIRGHRIELGEVEAALLRHPAVERAVAVVLERPAAHLAAMVTTVERTDTDAYAALPDLRARLSDELPAHMVPDRVTSAATLPLTANGKIDRKAVTAALTESSDAAPLVEPQGELETELAALWAELLDVPTVGRTDSFFLLGGDSLLGTRLVERMRRRFGIGISLRELTSAPTVERLAAVVEDLRGSEADMEEGVL
ncbi:non-ribosomal peptide synthetase [Saccharomonospora cyanea]|uniref:Phenyloxazoline synthase MbtB n=1 Tax=Saccharomonospora cyanea NA-134 TaxID=882082 RepID=H5XHL5_9PSEU|nr:non-ribosomal peptide synthetase [Saccharomonospora cyanea]EHR61695.1 amino acid adenylation enzyme/thioester reductase family protein [Saccharomonospora cyanea NA-134]